MSKYSPLLTRSEFDARSADLERRLREEWYDRRPHPPTGPPSSTSGPFAGLPDIDSKEVVRANVIFRDVLGVKFDPKLIKKGGYSSFDDFRDDAFSKIRQACRPDPVSTTFAHATESAHV